MQTRISELTEKERDWITLQINSARRFVDAYSPPDVDQPLTLAALDRAFAGFLTTNESDGKVINGVINCVGITFGQFLVDGAGMSWVIASDQHGTDLAVYALPGRGDVLNYPANFVAKRWERREAHFLEVSSKSIIDQVHAARQRCQMVATQKPWWKFW